LQLALEGESSPSPFTWSDHRPTLRLDAMGRKVAALRVEAGRRGIDDNEFSRAVAVASRKSKGKYHV
jgi:hypothetical protein